MKNFWHIQMNLGLVDGANLSQEEVLSMVRDKKIIGTGEWKDNKQDQCKQFKESMRIGDIVLVRNGIQPLALVEVSSNSYPNRTYENERSIKVLSLFNEEIPKIIGKYKGQAQGTLTIVQNKNSPTAKFIFSWYNSIIKFKEMDSLFNLIKYKKQIILQGPPGTGKTRLTKEIAEELIKPRNLDEKIHDVIENQLTVGLVVPMSHPGKTIEILEVGDINFKIRIPNGEIISQTKRSVFEVIKNQSFRKFGGDAYHKSLAIFLNDFLKDSAIGEFKLIQFHPAYTYEDFVRGIIVETNNEIHPEYKVVNKILAEFAAKALKNESSNFVLIIDEINRANLPSVLGELIYALEYRFDPEKPEETSVESMYSLREERNSEGPEDRILRLPNNLFIIGTMNTADRSVSHIDYAIRRRFAFVDVLPSIEPIKNESAKEYFKLVSELFVSNYEEVMFSKATPKRSACLVSDFGPEQVWIGHSYFITEKEGEQGDAEIRMKMKYEVLPLIKEYVKDGILNSDERNADDPVQTVINRLQE